MRAWLLVALLALAGAAAAQRPAPTPSEPGSAPYEGKALLGQWSNGPGPMDKHFSPELRLVEGRALKVWLLLEARSAVDSEVQVKAPESHFQINRTKVPLRLAAGESAAIPFLLTPLTGSGTAIGIFAEINVTADGAQTVDQFGATATVLPSVSVVFVKPVPQYLLQPGGYAQAVPTNVGARTNVEFTAQVRNHAANASASFPLVVATHGRAVSSTTVAPLAPGEHRNLSMGEFQLLRDMPEFASYGGGGFSVTLDFFLTTSPVDRGFNPAWSYEIKDGALISSLAQGVQVAFFSGVLAQASSVHVVLGKPSWIDIEVSNYGEETARNVRIDVRATPMPLAYYGPDSFLQETLYVTVDPLETKHLNVSFVPRVAGPLQVTVNPFLAGYYQPIISNFKLPSPLTVTPRESPPVVIGSLGDAATVTFVLNATANLTGAEIGFAVTDDNFWRTGVPFARLITADDIVKATAVPAKVDLVGNRSVWVNATLDLRAAGFYRLIPYLKVGDLVYVSHDAGAASGGGGGGVSIGGERPSGAGVGGSYEIRVGVVPFSIARLWLPLAAVVAGFGGYWIYRARSVL